MKGKYQIIIYNKKVKYEFELKRNITVIRGDSATGKTQLLSMIRDYNEQGQDSGVTVVCDKECKVIAGRQWKESLALISDSIVFIDEGNQFTKTQEFAEHIKGSSNYFVIVTREKLRMLPYSIHEIYGIRERGRYPILTQMFNEIYRLYPEQFQMKEPELLITEDGKSGYQFFCEVASSFSKECISAEGKSNIIDKIAEYASTEKKILAIVDGAAFGPEMEEVMDFCRFHEQVSVYAPESFEWLLLMSGVVSCAANELEHTYDYAESEKYFSWEQYYTELVKKLTADTAYPYLKEKLHVYYLSEVNRNKVLRTMGWY